MPDPFKGVPKLELRLYDEPDLMAKSYRSFHRNLRRLLEEESDHTFEYADAPSDKCSYDKCKYTVPVLPRRHTGRRWFEVDIYPPPSWKESKTVRLMFLFYNLYLLGFHGGKKKWKFFDDAELEGISEDDRNAYISFLGFSGTYNAIGQKYSVFDIGYQGQLSTYTILATFIDNSDDKDILKKNNDDMELRKALCRVVVTISEAMRFLQLMQLLIEVFEAGIVRFLDVEVSETELHKNISYHFKNWGVYCAAIRDGKDKYKMNKLPLPGLPEFRSFFSFVGVLLAVNASAPSSVNAPARSSVNASAPSSVSSK